MILLDRLILQFPTAKRQTLKEMVQDGRVLVNGRAAGKLKLEIGADDVVKVLAKEQVPTAGGTLPFRIVFEDADILVIDKPAGLLTSTTAHEKRTTALALVQKYLAENEPAARVGLIHRLDRDASGLLVLSKNDAAYRSLKAQFFEHTVKRIYSVIVLPVPSPAWGRIESNLAEWADGTVRSARMKNRGQPARTDYAVVREANGMALLKVTLHTGRKHQIRVHLSESGWPVVGDILYGGVSDVGGLMLAATELGLKHPASGEQKDFKIDLPVRMRSLSEVS